MDASDANRAIVIISKSGARSSPWPDWVIEYAFQAWAFLDNYSPLAVHNRLNSGEFVVTEDGKFAAVDVPVRTIQQWSKDQDWAERHERFLQQHAGGIVKRTLGNMLSLALDGSHHMANQARQGIPPNRDMVEAVKLALGAIGLSAIGSRDPSKSVLAGGQGRRVRGLDALSDDELLEMERKLSEPDE